MSIRCALLVVLLVMACALTKAAEPQAEQSPTELVKDYFSLLQAQHGPKAVQKYWNQTEFCKRVYEGDFEKLTPEEQNKTAQEHERLGIASYTNPTLAKLLQQIQVSSIEQKLEGTKASVKFELTHPMMPAKSQEWLLQLDAGQWRIVDMQTPQGPAMSESLRRQYKTTKLNPLEYAQEMTKALPKILEKAKSE